MGRVGTCGALRRLRGRGARVGRFPRAGPVPPPGTRFGTHARRSRTPSRRDDRGLPRRARADLSVRGGKRNAPSHLDPPDAPLGGAPEGAPDAPSHLGLGPHGGRPLDPRISLERPDRHDGCGPLVRPGAADRSDARSPSLALFSGDAPGAPLAHALRGRARRGRGGDGRLDHLAALLRGVPRARRRVLLAGRGDGRALLRLHGAGASQRPRARGAREHD